MIKIIINRLKHDDLPELLLPRWTGRYVGPASLPGLGAIERARRHGLELRRRQNRIRLPGNGCSHTGKTGACCPMEQYKKLRYYIIIIYNIVFFNEMIIAFLYLTVYSIIILYYTLQYKYHRLYACLKNIVLV